MIAAGAEITYDSVAMHRDGRAIPVEFIVRTMEHQDTQQRLTIVRDRRDRVAAAARIHNLAHHDALTGLPNRLSFDERVQALIAASHPLTGLQGPRKFRVRLYPHNVDGAGEALRHVIVDSVWVVDGEYAAPYRPYTEGIEVLSGTERIVMFSGTNVTANFGPSPIPSSVVVPTNAVGMVVELSIKSSNSSTVVTMLTDDDNGGGGPEVHEVAAMLVNRPTTTELTLPLIPGATPGPQFSLSGGSGTNLVNFAIVVKAWIYRL